MVSIHAYGVRLGDILILEDGTRIQVLKIKADSTSIKFDGKGGSVIVPREMKVTVK